MRATIRALLIIVVAVAVISGALAYSVISSGISARAEPGRIEEIVARSMRRLATPSAVRAQRNPVQANNAVLEEGLEHFADHCAVCHANNGSGDTEIGRNLYPRALDMRAPATQSLTDGELFSIIENGIRFTGMPGWGIGTPEGTSASWALVHFIRHLPALAPDEIARMEELNPRSRRQLRQEEIMRRFLAGEHMPPGSDVQPAHSGRHD